MGPAGLARIATSPPDRSCSGQNAVRIRVAPSARIHKDPYTPRAGTSCKPCDPLPRDGGCACKACQPFPERTGSHLQGVATASRTARPGPARLAAPCPSSGGSHGKACGGFPPRLGWVWAGLGLGSIRPGPSSPSSVMRPGVLRGHASGGAGARWCRLGGEPAGTPAVGW